MIKKPEKPVVIDNKKEKNIKNLFKLAIDNNYLLSN